MRALTVGDHFLVARDHWISVFAARGRARCMVVRLCVDRHSQCQPTGQRGATLQELPAASPFRTHRCFLRTHQSLLRKMAHHDEITSKRTRTYAVLPNLASAHEQIAHEQMVADG